MAISPRSITTTSPTDVVVVDFGLSNLASIARALEIAGAGRVRVVSEGAEAGSPTHLVLPGIGSFAAGMRALHDRGWPQEIAGSLAHTPLLGICLGMQMLCTESTEGGATVSGLGVVQGRIEQLPDTAGMRVPHVGWNSVELPAESPLMAGIGSGSDFYFVHSFALSGENDGALGRTQFGTAEFISVVATGHVFGTQFHPEKSSHSGIRLLTNFLSMPQPC